MKGIKAFLNFMMKLVKQFEYCLLEQEINNSMPVYVDSSYKKVKVQKPKQTEYLQ